MNAASLELSKELYELSGWVSNEGTFGFYEAGKNELHWGHRLWRGDGDIPAYDLGYLARRLVPFSLRCKANGDYEARWISDDETKAMGVSSSSPEDAVVRLAVKLLEMGVMERQSQS